jgi:hypothetical protein
VAKAHQCHTFNDFYSYSTSRKKRNNHNIFRQHKFFSIFNFANYVKILTVVSIESIRNIPTCNCTGCVSISENVVDNSARSGASGIWYTLPFDVASLVSMNNNKIFASNNSGGSIYEFYMDLNSGGTLAQGFALGNVVAASYGAAALPKVGLVNPYPSAGTIVNVTRSTVYFKDFSSADAWVYSESNMCTNSAGLVDWW